MSNPIATTVRGWLEQIYNRLAPSADTAGLLAEMRLLNKKLWGIDATGSIEAEPLAKMLRDSLTVSEANGNNPPTLTPLSQYMLNRLGVTTYEPTWLSLFALKYYADLTSGKLSYENDYDLNIAGSVFNSFEVLKAINESLFEAGTAQSQSSFLSQILAAIGKLQTAPGGFTARNLLARIALSAERSAECCEGSNGGGTTPGTIPDDDGNCDWVTTEWKVENWVRQGQTQQGDPPDTWRWFGVLPWDNTGPVGNLVNYEGLPMWTVSATAGVIIETCIGVNFVGNNNYQNAAAGVYPNAPSAASNIWSPTPPVTYYGWRNNEALIDTNNGLHRIACTIDMYQDVTPPTSVWVKIRYKPQ